jgi:hypothetical protein
MKKLQNIIVKKKEKTNIVLKSLVFLYFVFRFEDKPKKYS